MLELSERNKDQNKKLDHNEVNIKNNPLSWLLLILLVIFSFTSYAVGYTEGLPRDIRSLGFAPISINALFEALHSSFEASAKAIIMTFPLILLKVSLSLYPQSKHRWKRKILIWVRRKFWLVYAILFWSVFSLYFLIIFFGGVEFWFVTSLIVTCMFFMVGVGFVNFAEAQRSGAIKAPYISTFGSILGKTGHFRNWWIAIATICSLAMYFMGQHRFIADVVFGNSKLLHHNGEYFDLVKKLDEGYLAIREPNENLVCIDEAIFYYIPEDEVDIILFDGHIDRIYISCK